MRKTPLPYWKRVAIGVALVVALALVSLGCSQADADAAATKGQTCYIKGDYGCAVKAYGIAVREDPQNPAHHYDLAMSLLAAKMPTQAVPELRETIRLDPAHSDARRHLERLMR